MAGDPIREHTPTTAEVRLKYESASLGQSAAAEFDAWLDQVKAAARREGQAEAWDRAEWAAWDAHKRDHHEPWSHMPNNPYGEDRHVDQ